MKPRTDTQDLWTLVEQLGTCMLTTRDRGALRSRPMRPIVEALIGEIRFITSKTSHKADEIGVDPQVNLAFVDDRTGGYVSISGFATLSDDRELLRRAWNADADMWFSDGPDSEDASLLRVIPSQAELRERESGVIKAQWEKIKASLSEDKPDLGTSAKLQL